MFHWQTCIPHLLWPGTTNERLCSSVSIILLTIQVNIIGQYKISIEVVNMLYKVSRTEGFSGLSTKGHRLEVNKPLNNSHRVDTTACRPGE